ncbi:hypothetical protein C0Q70_07733 [Pomacea canaliculata]|uniref:Uncharacterized protein n=1 Tax=Pomacea canaliculata TaxID=400727 RepID=A0A2T7PFZ4_POMCA|nr:hypothetical protein C0Q70_07733 [Pomacea canaliculata]
MKKYRYGDPAKSGILRKYGRWIYFVVAWNLLGVVAWNALNVKKSKSDENWDSKSANQRYLEIIGIKENTKHIKIQGLSKVEVVNGNDH